MVSALRHFPNESTYAEVNVNVTGDLFPDEHTAYLFARLCALLNEGGIDEAVVTHCTSNNCQHPFPKLSKVSNYLEKLRSALGHYENRYLLIFFSK